MKRAVATLVSTGLLATALGSVALSQSAFADGALPVHIESAGTKKVEVTWDDGTAAASAPFDAYLVTLDNDADANPFAADRSLQVSTADPRSATFSDLSSSTTYYAEVYAIDYTGAFPGFTIIPATGQDPDTALGTQSASYTPVTIRSSSATVMSGKSVTLSGAVTGTTFPATIAVLWDVYPQFGGTDETTKQTSDTGRWSYTTAPLTESTWFFAEHRAGPESVGGWTARILVEVRKRITIQVTPGLRVKALTQVKFTGKVGGNPAYLDDSGSMAKACLQRKQGTGWSKLVCKPLEASGEYSLTFKPGQNASGKYRVFSGMGPAYADSWSATKKLVVT